MHFAYNFYWAETFFLGSLAWVFARWSRQTPLTSSEAPPRGLRKALFNKIVQWAPHCTSQFCIIFITTWLRLGQILFRLTEETTQSILTYKITGFKPCLQTRILITFSLQWNREWWGSVQSYKSVNEELWIEPYHNRRLKPQNRLKEHNLFCVQNTNITYTKQSCSQRLSKNSDTDRFWRMMQQSLDEGAMRK